MTRSERADALDYYSDWDRVAADTVATLRHESGKYPGDPVLASLVGELSVASVAFAELWAHQDLQLEADGLIRINHPAVGELRLNYEFLGAGDGAEELVTYTADDRASADALVLLGTLTDSTAGAGPNPADDQRNGRRSSANLPPVGRRALDPERALPHALGLPRRAVPPQRP